MGEVKGNCNVPVSRVRVRRQRPLHDHPGQQPEHAGVQGIRFVQVDDENMVLYLRFYQKFISTLGLRRVINALSMPFNIVVAHQDRRVVETQQPKQTDLWMGRSCSWATARSSGIAGGGRS